MDTPKEPAQAGGIEGGGDPNKKEVPNVVGSLPHPLLEKAKEGNRKGTLTVGSDIETYHWYVRENWKKFLRGRPDPISVDADGKKTGVSRGNVIGCLVAVVIGDHAAISASRVNKADLEYTELIDVVKEEKRARKADFDSVCLECLIGSRTVTEPPDKELSFQIAFNRAWSIFPREVMRNAFGEGGEEIKRYSRGRRVMNWALPQSLQKPMDIFISRVHERFPSVSVIHFGWRTLSPLHDHRPDVMHYVAPNGERRILVGLSDEVKKSIEADTNEAMEKRKVEYP